MKPIMLYSRKKRVRVEIENAFAEDRRKRYVLLHVAGPNIRIGREQINDRVWRMGWHVASPHVHIRGILFGVHFMVEARSE